MQVQLIWISYFLPIYLTLDILINGHVIEASMLNHKVLLNLKWIFPQFPFVHMLESHVHYFFNHASMLMLL